MGEHSATLTFGAPGDIHGFRTITLSDPAGDPAPVHSIASGLDYPGVGPEHAFLQGAGRVKYAKVSDQETLRAFYDLSRYEGIIPALESAHALAFAFKFAADRPGETILVNLSGRGDKDIDYVAETHGFGDLD
ncbi:MAG: tryptophan synthase subunit beta, partial [Sphingomonadales bacterium]